jgi:adhesin transport system outer membrane protein
MRAVVTGHPQLESVRADRRASDHDRRQAVAGYLPSLELRGAVGPEYTDSPIVRARSARREDSGGITLWRNEGTLTLRQRLFDGFGTGARVESAEASVALAAARVLDRAQTLALGAAEAYLEVLRHGELRQLAAESLEGHSRIGQLVDRLVREGKQAEAAQREAAARVARARSVLTQAEGRLEEARATYERFVGDHAARPGVPGARVPATLDAARAASERSPAVAVAAADVEQTLREIRVAESRMWPTLDLELNAQAGENVGGIPGRTRDYYGQLVLRYDLFKGGADRARIDATMERHFSARARVADARRAAEQEARLAWAALEAAQRRLGDLADEVEQRRRARDLYLIQYELATRSAVDLLDAEEDLYLARSSAVSNEYVALFSQLRLLAASGQLLPAFGIDPPTESRPDRR